MKSHLRYMTPETPRYREDVLRTNPLIVDAGVLGYQGEVDIYTVFPEWFRDQMASENVYPEYYKSYSLPVAASSEDSRNNSDLNIASSMAQLDKLLKHLPEVGMIDNWALELSDGSKANVNETDVQWDVCYGGFWGDDGELGRAWIPVKSLHAAEFDFFYRCNAGARVIPTYCRRDDFLEKFSANFSMYSDLDIINTTKCREVYGAAPAWEAAWFEEIIMYHRLPFVIKYISMFHPGTLLDYHV